MKEKESNNTSNLTRLVAIALGLPWVEILTEAWKYARKLLRGLVNEGVYEVLNYETTLEIHDRKGKKATVKKQEKIRYLQNNIYSYQDQAWGDGKILVNYRCAPGVEVDRYRSGHKTLILITLRKVMNKGDKEKFNIEWEMQNGFLSETCYWGTDIEHKTRKIKVNIIFPKNRPPIQVWLEQKTRKQMVDIGKEALIKLPDGRWQISWEKLDPKLYESYILKWEW